MNIFILDKCPVKSAQMQCDKHVVKMILESGQMLSTAHRMLDGKLTKRPSQSGKTMSKYWELSDPIMEKALYKAVHTGHPCTVWTMETNSNYNWHYKHFIALCDEYTKRYGKVHMTDTKLRDILRRPPVMTNYSNERTPFRLAMGASPECIDHSDPIGSYRKFYQTKQERFSMTWTNSIVPDWFRYNVAI